MYNYSWYSNNHDLLSSDTIHQILAFGDLKDIKKLEKQIGRETLRKLFLQKPKKVYTIEGLNFLKKFILHLNKPIYDDQYLKTTPRIIR